MKNAVLIHGWRSKDEYYDTKSPTSSNDHWFPWLSVRLMQQDIFTVAVEMPRPFQPRYEAWRKEFERYEITKETILVGHSCGGGFLVRWLTENPEVKVAKVILVAPWVNPDDDAGHDTTDFFHFDISEQLASQADQFVIIYSLDDDQSVLESVKRIKSTASTALVREFTGKRHFCKEDLGTEEFPELLEEILA